MDNRHDHLLSPVHASVAGLLVSAVAGCGSLQASQTPRQAPVEARASLPTTDTGGTGDAEAITQNRRIPSQDRVIFSDEASDSPNGTIAAESMAGAFGDPSAAEATSGPSTGSQGGGTSGQDSLIGALAASYDDDMKALARMQQERDAQRQARANARQPQTVEFHQDASQEDQGREVAASTPATSTPATSTPATSTPVVSAPSAPTSATPAPTNLPPTPPASGVGGQAQPSSVNAAPTVSEPVTAPSTTPDSAAPKPGVSAAAQPTQETATAPTSIATEPPQVAANGALALPESTPIPTDPTALRALLQESLVTQAGGSNHPLREWFGIAALALTDPDAALPKNFADAADGPASDLLAAERERVVQAHAAFVAIGKALAAGETISATDAEALVAALTGGPKIAVPKIEFCTKIEGFGRFTPVQNDRFLAGSKARFIVYSEVADFTSALDNGAFTTRLATRVSIESERDGVVVWRRSPEWTAVVDSSPTRRDEFFVGEIVTLTEYLSVGGYRLKVEIRDEATGVVGVATRPFVVVADPAMAAVSD